MGTVIVGVVVVGVVGQESHSSAEATASTVEDIATEQKRMEQPMQQRNMQKDAILNRLRQRGCRITKQRMVLLDIILDGDCSSCKEIYYKASKIDPSIGSATVYRMINMLEEIGAINRRNMYRVSCTQPCDELEDDAQNSGKHSCTSELDDNSSIVLTQKAWNQIIQAGLSVCGYKDKQAIRSINPA